MSGATKQTSTPGPWEGVGHGVYTVADNPCREILWHGHNTRSAPDKEREANAHLIAAAPDMLAALKEVAEVASSTQSRFTRQDILKYIAAAIAKAEGGVS